MSLLTKETSLGPQSKIPAKYRVQIATAEGMFGGAAITSAIIAYEGDHKKAWVALTLTGFGLVMDTFRNGNLVRKDSFIDGGMAAAESLQRTIEAIEETEPVQALVDNRGEV